MKQVIGFDGKMNHFAGKFEGLYVKQARKAIVKEMQKKDLIEKLELMKKDNVNKKIPKTEEPPEGWVEGRYIPEENKFKGHSPEVLQILSDKRQDKIYITDGITNFLVDSTSTIPEGWYQGLTRHKKDKLMFITDNVISRKIKLDDDIPEGWRKGRTFNSGNKK